MRFAFRKLRKQQNPKLWSLPDVGELRRSEASGRTDPGRNDIAYGEKNYSIWGKRSICMLAPHSGQGASKLPIAKSESSNVLADLFIYRRSCYCCYRSAIKYHSG